MNIKHKITLYTALLVAVMGLVIISVVYREVSMSFYRQIVREQESRLRVAWHLLRNKGALQVVNGKMLAGNQTLNNDAELVDQIAELVGGTATIFQDNIRIATNVRLPDGSRALGTRLADPVYAKIRADQKPFSGEMNILGEPYLTAYDTIHDFSGRTIGVLQVGAKKASYNSTLANILFRSLLVTIIGMALIGYVVYWALHRLTVAVAWLNHTHDMVLDCAGEGIYGVDVDGQCIFINAAGAHGLGYQQDELLGKHLNQIIHHCEKPKDRCFDKGVCHQCPDSAWGEMRRSGNTTFWKKDGSMFLATFTSTPLLENGIIKGAVVVFKEVASS